MRKNKNFLIISILLLLPFIGLTGCQKEENITNDSDLKPGIHESDLSTDKNDKMDEIDQMAKKDVNEKEIKREKIDEAISYIHKHIDDENKNNEVQEKLAYYGSYLKYIGNKEGADTNHELAKWGNDVHTYIRNIYTNIEESTSDVSKDLKKSIDTTKEKIIEGKEDLIESFYNIIK